MSALTEKFTVEFDKENNVFVIHTTCPWCDGKRDILMPPIDYTKISQGQVHIGDLSHISADDREALISGICPKCWDDYLGD